MTRQVATVAIMESRAKYRRHLWTNRTLVAAWVVIAILSAAHRDVTMTGISLLVITTGCILLADNMLRWERTLEEWDAATKMCAWCRERPRTHWAPAIIGTLVDGVLTGDEVMLPACDECSGAGDRAKAAVRA